MSRSVTHSFLGSLHGPIDAATYDKNAPWRWISWRGWGRAERWVKLLAYTYGIAAPVLLFLDGTWSFHGARGK
ncbi:MAG: hypothetical protein VCC00_08185 [Deltaproteobacteria bacterium]